MTVRVRPFHSISGLESLFPDPSVLGSQPCQLVEIPRPRIQSAEHLGQVMQPFGDQVMDAFGAFVAAIDAEQA